MPQKLLTAFFLCSILILPQLSLAQGTAPGSTVPDSFYNTPPTIDPTEAVITKGGFVPCSGVGCSACDFVVMANTITKWLIGISFIFFAVLCVIAGTKMITSGGNPSALSDAKKSLTNAFIGLIIIMAAWLAVDTLLRGLLKGNNGQIEGYGPWSQVRCAQQAQSTTENLGFDENINWQPGQQMQNSRGASTYTGGPLAQCAGGNAACNVSTLTSAGFNTSQANVMSCIAMTESSGNAAIGPYNLRHPGSNSSACGLFQITRTTWRATATGACADFSNCTNAVCNRQTAVRLVQQSGYTPWTCPGCNTRAQGCINQYGG